MREAFPQKPQKTLMVKAAKNPLRGNSLLGHQNGVRLSIM